MITNPFGWFLHSFHSFVIYSQESVDGAEDKRIIRRLLRQKDLRVIRIELR
jgi:hypothetical protein